MSETVHGVELSLLSKLDLQYLYVGKHFKVYHFPVLLRKVIYFTEIKNSAIHYTLLYEPSNTFGL